jgi:hypothetical protein
VFYQNISKLSAPDFDRRVNDEPDYSPYDFASIMHYGAYADSEERRGPTIETIPAGIPIGQRRSLSLGDIDTVRHMYGFPAKGITVATHVSGLKIVVDGVEYKSPQWFDWKPGTTHSIEAPEEQIDGDIVYEFGRWSDDGDHLHVITASPAQTLYTANFIQRWRNQVAKRPDDANGRISANDSKRRQRSEAGDRTRPGRPEPRRAPSPGGQDDRARDLQSRNPAPAPN